MFQVYWQMRDEHGWNPDWFYGQGGNNALHQDVIDGMKLQPCTPNFVQVDLNFMLDSSFLVFIQ